MGVALVALTLAPASAAAEEQRIASGPAEAVEADAGWVSFIGQRGERIAGRGRRFAPIGRNLEGFQLGTDRRGRAVGLYRSCPRRGSCALRQRLMATGRTRTLRRMPRRVFFRADMHRGWLALAYSAITPRTTRVSVRRPGRRTLRWTETGRPTDMDMGSRRLLLLTSESFSDRLRLVMVGGAGPKRRTLVVDDGFDEECRCTMSAQDLTSASFDGRYAYWLEDERQSVDQYPLGTGARFSEVDRVFRTDTNTRLQPNQAADLPRTVRDISVDRRRVFYRGSDQQQSLYALTGPAWQPAGSGRRTLRPSE